MDIQALKEKIESLDPKDHESLIDALIAEYNRLAGQKGEAAKPQSQPAPDPFAEMFKKVVDGLNKRYIEGTIDYVRKLHPDLYQKIKEAEDKLNQVWKGKSSRESRH